MNVNFIYLSLHKTLGDEKHLTTIIFKIYFGPIGLQLITGWYAYVHCKRVFSVHLVGSLITEHVLKKILYYAHLCNAPTIRYSSVS